jgi:catechol 2,3-dioxygenase-like lactoylglutathione lyase family enzyme
VKTTGLHHVAVNVHELEPAMTFYVDQLGFTALDRPDFGFPGAWIPAGDHQIHLMEIPSATIDRGQHLALRVDDVDAAVAEVEAAGVMGRRSEYRAGAGRQAFLRDPSGNRIELNEPDKR